MFSAVYSQTFFGRHDVKKKWSSGVDSIQFPPDGESGPPEIEIRRVLVTPSCHFGLLAQKIDFH